MSVTRVNDLHKVLEVVHKEVRDTKQGMRKISQQTHNANDNVASLNFLVRDYVMRYPINA